MTHPDHDHHGDQQDRDDGRRPPATRGARHDRSLGPR
jgi:hypothetical protein